MKKISRIFFKSTVRKYKKKYISYMYFLAFCSRAHRASFTYINAS